jgi:hypothetical protein
MKSMLKPSFLGPLTAIAALSLLVWFSTHSMAQRNPSTHPADTGFAVVELFTSDGCSSCPPADAALAELAASARKSGAPIFPLAFHVDYFNNLGWADRFSDPAYSSRQSDYARALNFDEVFTPQMIVNGTDQFVGSDRDSIKRAVGAALSKPAAATVAVKVSSNAAGSYRISYTVVGAGPDAVANIAVVERGLISSIGGGENAGRVLPEENVVRWFRSVTISADGKNQIEVPRLNDVNFKNASVIVYAQEPANGPVLGAASADFP